jgi:hypothetical protein
VSGGNEINPSSSLTNEYLTPGSDTGNAGAVKSYNTAAVSYTSPLVPGGMTVSGLSGLLSFYWGSIDSYNQITFQGGEDVVYTGSNLATALGLTLGDYGNYNTDRYVSFVGDFTSAVFTTIYNAGNGNPKAFEVAVADVPEASGISTLLVVGAVAGGFALKNRLQQA